MSETFDTSDPKAVKAAIKDAKSAETIAREGLRQTMGTEQGRKWLYRALMLCDPFRNPFSTDALAMAFRCGEVNIGLQLIAEMQEVSPDLYLQMMKENK
jgi:hypothetical protein